MLPPTIPFPYNFMHWTTSRTSPPRRTSEIWLEIPELVSSPLNVLVAKGDRAAHILPEYGLSWVGGDSRLALEATRDALHGNSQQEAWERTCYGAFEQW